MTGLTLFMWSVLCGYAFHASMDKGYRYVMSEWCDCGERKINGVCPLGINGE